MSITLGTVAGIAAIASVASSVIKGVGRVMQIDDKKNELDTKIANLKEMKEATVGNIRADYADKNALIDTQISQADALQKASLGQSVASQAVQDQLYNAQIAELQVEASTQEGSAIQTAAVSGFRGDMEGSLGSGKRTVNRATARAIEQARLQARGARMESYFTAVNNYTSAEYQKQRYKEQQTYNINSGERQIELIEKEWKQTNDQLTDEREYMDSFWYGAMSYLGIGVDVAGEVLDTGYTYYARKQTGFSGSGE